MLLLLSQTQLFSSAPCSQPALKLLLLHLTTPDFQHVISDIEIIWNDFRHELRLSIHCVSSNELDVSLWLYKYESSSVARWRYSFSEARILFDTKRNWIQYLLDRLKIPTLYCFRSHLKPWLVTQTGNDLLKS